MYPPERQYKYFHDKLCGTGLYKSDNRNKSNRVFGTYRRGIKQENESQDRREQSEVSTNVGSPDQVSGDKGEYP